MASFCGNWKLFESDNFVAFMVATGVTPENVEKAGKALSVSSNLVQHISISGDEWTITITSDAGEKTYKFKLGQEIASSTLDGREIKLTFTLEGDKLIETHKGEGHESKRVRTVSGNEMTMVLCGYGVTSTRKYKKID